MKYVLKNVRTDRYFKGYPGKGKGKKLGNKPFWTDHVAEAAQYDGLGIAMRVQKRLFCQSQYVRLISVDQVFIGHKSIIV